MRSTTRPACVCARIRSRSTSSSRGYRPFNGKRAPQPNVGARELSEATMKRRYAARLALDAVVVSAGLLVTSSTLSGIESARAGDLEQVAALQGSMPTGVTVSQEGRIFVNFPRWG